MELSDKKVTRITILSTGLTETESVGKWHRKVKQHALDEVVVDHYSLNPYQGVRHISAPSLLERPSALASNDLVIIILGTEATCPLPPVLLQQAQDIKLSLVVLLADGSRHAVSDLQIPEERASIIRTDMPVYTAVEKLLQPLVSQVLIGVDVNDFKIVAPVGSRGFMANAVDTGKDVACKAAKKALSDCQKEMTDMVGTVNLMANMVGHNETFTVGDFSKVGETIEAFASDSATVICNSSVSEAMARDAFDITVLMMEEPVAFLGSQSLH